MFDVANSFAHRRKALHNEKFLGVIQRNDVGPSFLYPDWMVTVAFYIGLHYVDARLARMVPSLHPRDHAERNNYVANNLPHDIASDYFFLEGKSKFARYFPDSKKKISANMANKCVNLALTRFA